MTSAGEWQRTFSRKVPPRTVSGTDRLVVLTQRRPIRSLLANLRPHRLKLVGIASIFLLKDAPLWVIPIITARTIDLVVDEGPLIEIGYLGAAAALLLIQVYPMHLLFTRLYMDIVRWLGVALRNAVTAHLQALSIGYHGRTSAAVIQSKVVRDVENIEIMLAQVSNPLGSASIAFAGAIVMTSISVPQFLPVFALTIPAGVFLWWSLRQRARHRNEAFRRQMEQFSRRVGEMAALMPITRAHGLEDVALKRITEGAEDVRRDGLSLDMLNGKFGSLSWIVMQLLSVGCLVTAAALAVLRWAPISAGDVVLLGTYFTTLTGTVMTVLNFMPLISRGRESAVSLAEVLEDPDIEENEGKTPVRHVAGDFKMVNVTVRYPGANNLALDNVSLDIAAGQTIALVGTSGSGKSTLVNVLLGFVRPTEGRIFLDGTDIATLDLRTARRAVSVVPQESVLFEGSIRANVEYGLGRVSDTQLRDALIRANAWEIVAALPDGWDAIVGERGARLSGGQRQRLSIARALIRNPRVLVLDEATSALDSESERKVQQALERLMKGRTTLVVAHRLSTVRHADQIVVLDHGRIAEQGTHESLVASKGRYARLWKLQAS